MSNLRSSGLLKFDDASQRPSLNEEALLELSDAARAGLTKGHTDKSVADKATQFVQAAARDEMYGIPTIEISTIANARLDKLLADVLSPENHVEVGASHAWSDLPMAERLQRQWRARFREKYFDIDQTRYLTLSKTGLLRDVIFDDQAKNDHELWCAESCEVLSAGEGNLRFEAGQ